VSKKDIQQDGDLKPTKVGHSVYVWTRDGAPPPVGKECLISAHGIEAKINSKLAVPDIDIVYYGPHGYTLKQHAIDVGWGVASVNQRVAAGTATQDYILTKFQGRSSKWEETNKKIQNPGSANPHLAQYTKDLDDVEKLTHLSEDQLTQLRNLRRGKVQGLREKFDLDVVTIRSRSKYADRISLWELLALLKDNNIHYSAAHCSFCRGYRDGSDEGSYIA
jgi:hypothetical protein